MKKYQLVLFPMVNTITTIYNIMIKSRIDLYEKIKSKASLFNKGILITTAILVIIGLVIFLKPPIIVYLLVLIITSAIYWIGFVGIHKSSLQETNKKQNRSSTSKKNGLETYNRITQYIINEKKYQSTDISLHQIASQFDISSGYLSQLINVHAQKSSNDFINELRIKDAQQMLLDTNYDHYTIESIGLECGFKSKSNFYTTFKKITGQTPNQYKKLKK